MHYILGGTNNDEYNHVYNKTRRIDLKKRNSFHFLLAKREYDTLMLVVNYIKHQAKEDLFHNVKNLRKMYGFQKHHIKHGKLSGNGFPNEDTINRYQDFMSSMEHLAAHTFQEYLKFYRQVLNQQDNNGRSPIHYAIDELSIRDVLNINLEEEQGFDEFIQY